LLQSIKAKIRSNVARIIKDAGDHQKYTSPELNFINSADGKVALLVVKELLQKLNLKESLLVFEAEASLENSKENDIENIWKTLSLTDRRTTLLENLLQSRKDYLEQGERPLTTTRNEAMSSPVTSSLNSVTTSVASPQLARTTSVDLPTASPPRSKESPAKPASDKMASEDKYYRETNDAHRVPDDAEEVAEEVEEFEEDFEEADEVEQSSSFAQSNSFAQEKSSSKSPASSYSKDLKEDQIADEKRSAVASPLDKKPSVVNFQDEDEYDNDDIDAGFPGRHDSVSKSSPLAVSVSPKASTSTSLPEVKPSGRFHFRAGEILEPEITKKDENFDEDGPEVDSEIEEEEYSQLDQDVEVSQSFVPALSKKVDSNDDNSVVAGNSNVREIAVTGQMSPSNAANSRAQVTRLEGSNVTRRSTRGWDLPAEGNESFEQSRDGKHFDDDKDDDNDDDDVDAMQQSHDSQGNSASRVMTSRYGSSAPSTRSYAPKARDDDDDYRAHDEDIVVGDNSFEDSNNSSVDQTHSSSLARGPGRRQYPLRSSPSPGRPTRSSGHNNATSAFANLNESEASHEQADLAQSYRSNQEDEEDDDHRQQWLQQQKSKQQGSNNAHLYDDAEDLPDDEEDYDEDDYENDDDNVKKSPAPAATTTTTSLFSRNNIATNVSRTATERSVLDQSDPFELDDAEDDDENYGDEDFEQDDEDNRGKSFSKGNTSNIAPAAVSTKPIAKAAVPADDDIEEIEEEEEVEEELSVGQASEDDDGDNSDDGGWANKLNAPTSSMARQTSGSLPTVHSLGRNGGESAGTQRGRHDFSAALNDFDSDEDDAPKPAQRSSSNNNNNKMNNNTSSMNRNNNARTAYGPEISDDEEDDDGENSVASENLSVGDDNHSDSGSF
jgi:hypothetical protein